MPWPKGRKQSDEQKKKKADALRGRKRPQEVIEKVRLALRGRGKGRSSWRYEEWRRLVLEKNGKLCALCSSIEKIHVHHIVPWKKSKKLRFCVENGQVLCASCHIKIGLENKEISESTRFKKGHKNSEEARRKISEANKGRPTWNKGGSSWNKGKSCSNETKEKISKSKSGRPSWNKGKSWSEEYKKKLSESKKRKIAERKLNGRSKC